jgi:hypothetical protein
MSSFDRDDVCGVFNDLVEETCAMLSCLCGERDDKAPIKPELHNLKSGL